MSLPDLTKRLREAARVLRESATIPSDRGPWSWRVTGDRKWAVVIRDDGEWMAQVDDDDRAAYIATMHPGVGLALADWLDDVAKSWAPHFEDDEPALDFDGHPIRFEETCDARSLALADLILGGAS